MQSGESVKGYRATYIACGLGSVAQAVIAGMTPLLFVCFMGMYGFGVWQLGIMAGLNFALQLCADLLLTGLVDRVSHRRLILVALAVSAAGLVAFAFLPQVPGLGARGIYAVMLAATCVFSFGGGMLEVMISPITDAVPSASGKSALSLVHSCYAFGMVAVAATTGVFVHFAGAAKWPLIVAVWIIPALVSAALFLFCPVPQKRTIERAGGRKKRLTPYLAVALVAIFTAGSAEIVMNQYIATLATITLGFDAFVSDVAGMAMFAFGLGTVRLVYGLMGERLNIYVLLIGGSAAAVACYLVAGLCPVPAVALAACVVCGFAVSVLWPGTLAAVSRDDGGAAWAFALLAACGDVGDSAASAGAGGLAEAIGLSNTFAISAVLPAIALACFVIMCGMARRRGKKDITLEENI